MGGVLIEVDATVGKLAEGSLLLDLGGLNGVLWLKISAFVHFNLKAIADGNGMADLILTYSSAMIAVVD